MRSLWVLRWWWMWLCWKSGWGGLLWDTGVVERLWNEAQLVCLGGLAERASSRRERNAVVYCWRWGGTRVDEATLKPFEASHHE